MTTLLAELEGTAVAREITVEVARAAIDTARRSIQSGRRVDPTELARTELARLGRIRPQTVINATGVLLNTNLGRAPLHPEAAAAAGAALAEYSNVEFDLTDGGRGRRGEYVHRLVAVLTGAEAALVVNNNAGALYLALAALAHGRQVLISRGELIEIGGSFRLPELMGAAGAQLMEVGTTNRTRTDDYDRALRPETALVLKVHPANYRMVGFTEEAGYQELATMAHRYDLPFVADIGSGLLDAEVPWLSGPPPAWLDGEPAAAQTLQAGADLVLFSGDKLLGGPQAGIIAGSDRLVKRLRRHPAARAVRCDSSSLAALAATLDLYANGRGSEVPFWRMVAAESRELHGRCEALLEASRVDGEIIGGASVVGAGSVPGQTIPSPILRLSTIDTDRVWGHLVSGEPAIVARRHEGDLIIDLRAVPAAADAVLAAALSDACRS